jgi:hypothetical protein
MKSFCNRQMANDNWQSFLAILEKLLLFTFDFLLYFLEGLGDGDGNLFFSCNSISLLVGNQGQFSLETSWA